MKTYITPEKILEMTFKDDIPQIPKTVYIFFYKSLVKKIEEHFNLEKISFTRGDFYIEKNRDFGIITNFGAGESGALMLAEELSAIGVERVVAVGAVGSLSDDLKMVITLYFVEGFSYKEISNALNISLSAVKSRLHRARRSLAQSWSNKPYQNLNHERKYNESPAL